MISMMVSMMTSMIIGMIMQKILTEMCLARLCDGELAESVSSGSLLSAGISTKV